MMTISSLSFDALDEWLHDHARDVSQSDWSTFLRLSDDVEAQRDEIARLGCAERMNAKLYVGTRQALEFTRLYRTHLNWMLGLKPRRFALQR